MEDVEDKAELNAEDRLLDLLAASSSDASSGKFTEERGADRGDDDSHRDTRDAGDAVALRRAGRN